MQSTKSHNDDVQLQNTSKRLQGDDKHSHAQLVSVSVEQIESALNLNINHTVLEEQISPVSQRKKFKVSHKNAIFLDLLTCNKLENSAKHC